jgi:hypothetical protein
LHKVAYVGGSEILATGAREGLGKDAMMAVTLVMVLPLRSKGSMETVGRRRAVGTGRKKEGLLVLKHFY